MITTVLFDPDGSKANADISVYPHGGFEELKAFLNSLSGSL